MELNAKYWGEGFTEWNSLVKAQRGSRSPSDCTITPGELGFYDLRSRDIRVRQGELARAAGLSAFAVYHYWSAGHRVMSEVVDAISVDGAPDFPFFLFWANHDWTLAWQGRPDVVTLKQEYECPSDYGHIDYILSMAENSRYTKLSGRPLIGVFDVMAVPDFNEVVESWNRRAIEAGWDGVCVIAVDRPVADTLDFNVDMWVQNLGSAFGRIPNFKFALELLKNPLQAARFVAKGDRRVPADVIEQALVEDLKASGRSLVPMVLPGWNNSGRRPRRAWYTNLGPESLQRQLNNVSEFRKGFRVGDEKVEVLCVNAWNEWGEGMAVEPSVEYGRECLEVLRRHL